MNGEPIWAVPQWRRAVDAAGGQCECAEWAKGHAHHTHDRRCPRRQGEGGARLYLGRDGRVRCESCHDRAEIHARAAEAAARRDQAPEIDALF
jgi:hypothetical protein